MGRMILALALALIVTVAACAACRAEMDRAVDSALPHVQAAMDAALRLDTSSALTSLQRARAGWQSREKSLMLFLPHSRLEAVLCQFEKCECALLFGQIDAFLPEARILHRMLISLAQNERLTWENLL